MHAMKDGVEATSSDCRVVVGFSRVPDLDPHVCTIRRTSGTVVDDAALFPAALDIAASQRQPFSKPTFDARTQSATFNHTIAIHTLTLRRNRQHDTLADEVRRATKPDPTSTYCVVSVIEASPGRRTISRMEFGTERPRKIEASPPSTVCTRCNILLEPLTVPALACRSPLARTPSGPTMTRPLVIPTLLLHPQYCPLGAR